VKEAREALGLSKSALSELVGVRRATIVAIEQGTTTGVDFDTLERLAKALEVEPSWLLVRARK
jgi:transcriptional regulator with XRE-family HTH domain